MKKHTLSAVDLLMESGDAAGIVAQVDSILIASFAVASTAVSNPLGIIPNWVALLIVAPLFFSLSTVLAFVLYESAEHPPIELNGFPDFIDGSFLFLYVSALGASLSMGVATISVILLYVGTI